MTVAELIAKLQQHHPDTVVKIYNEDTRQFEPVTGLLFGGTEDVIELHSIDVEDE